MIERHDNEYYDEVIKKRPVVGMPVTIRHGSDRIVGDIVSITKSGKTITIREREVKLVKTPVMEEGGFTGVVVEDAVWKTTPNPNGRIIKASYRQSYEGFVERGFPVNGTWGHVSLDCDRYYYDYSF